MDVRHHCRAGQSRPRQRPGHGLAIGAQFAAECAASLDELRRHFSEPRQPRAERDRLVVIGAHAQRRHAGRHADDRQRQ